MIHLKRRAARKARANARETSKLDFPGQESTEFRDRAAAIFDTPIVHKLSDAVGSAVNFAVK